MVKQINTCTHSHYILAVLVNISLGIQSTPSITLLIFPYSSIKNRGWGNVIFLQQRNCQREINSQEERESGQHSDMKCLIDIDS